MAQNVPLTVSAALVNKGNCVFVNGEYEKAIDFYTEALSVDSSFTEALYNLGESINPSLESISDALIRACLQKTWKL